MGRKNVLASMPMTVPPATIGHCAKAVSSTTSPTHAASACLGTTVSQGICARSGRLRVCMEVILTLLWHGYHNRRYASVKGGYPL